MEERPPTRAGGRRPASYGGARATGALPSLTQDLIPLQTGALTVPVAPAAAPASTGILSPPSSATCSASQLPSSRVSPITASCSSGTAASSRCSSTATSSHARLGPSTSQRCGSGPLPLALPLTAALPQGVAPLHQLQAFMAAGAAVGSAQLLAAAMSFTRRSTTQAGGSLLDSIGLPGEEHGAMYEALIIDDEEVLASPSAAAAAANAAAASLAARSAVEYGPASGAGAFASGGGGGGAGTAPAGQFMPRPPATPPPVPRGSVSGVHIDGGGGGGTGATAEPAAVSPVAARIRVHRGPIFNFGDLDRDGSGTGGGGGATPATSSGQAAVSPAAAAVGSGFVQAPPRFARASTTIGVSSAPLATPSRGTLLPAGEPPGDPAAYLARGASACGAAAGVCAPGGASGAATPTCAAAVSSGAVDLPGHAAGRKLLPPLQRAALHAQQTASPRVSLTGAGSGGLSPSAAAGPGPNSANVLGRGSVSGIGPATFGASGGGAAVPGLRAMSSSLTSPGSFSDLKCQVSVLCDDEAAGLIATSGPSPAAARANGGTAGLSSFALLSGAAQSGGKALHPPGRNSTGGNSGGGGPSARSNNDLINAAAAEIPAVEVGLALTPHGAGAGVIAGPLPSVDATATAAALSALAAHTSAHSPLPQAKTGDTSLGGSLSRPLLPHRRALTEVPALEAS